jgi:hypothetical protein
MGYGATRARGPKKKNRRTLTQLVVGWFLVPREAKKVPGLVRFFGEILNRVFELPSPSPRNAQKRDKTNREKGDFGFFWRFFCKNFSLFDTIFW